MKKNAERGTRNAESEPEVFPFIVHRSSFIVSFSSLIPHPSSFILVPALPS
jgi:hypothetical protein